MKVSRIVATLVILVASSACGSKNKAEPTGPKTDTIKVEPEPEPVAEPEPEPVAEPEPEPEPRAELQEVVYFEFDSSLLDDAARDKLEANAEWLQEDPARQLTIEGHTDEAGTNEYNLGLGQRRAQAAKDYLVRLGIEAHRVKIITYGEERPASGVDSENRRSVFVATK